jgi:hypothetical protein
MTKELINQAISDIAKYRTALTAIPSIYIQCPNFPPKHTLTGAEILIHVFCRHSLRTIYYASNFLNNLLNLSTYEIAVEHGKTVMVPIPDDIYFDFDAFIFSAKSIFSGTIVGKAKVLHKDVSPLFVTLASRAKKEFIDPLLNRIRNEVVHLYGSSIGSLAKLTNQGDRWTVEIATAFYTVNNREVELISLFFHVLGKTTTLVMDILGLFLLHIFKKFGTPDKDFGYVSGGVEVRLSDYNIPGMHF